MTPSPFSNYLMTQIRNGVALKLTPDQRVEALASVVEVLRYLDVAPKAVNALGAYVAAELKALPEQDRPAASLKELRAALRTHVGLKPRETVA